MNSFTQPDRGPKPTGDPQFTEPVPNPAPPGDPRPDRSGPDPKPYPPPTDRVLSASKKVDDISRHESRHDAKQEPKPGSALDQHPAQPPAEGTKPQGQPGRTPMPEKVRQS